MFRRYRASEHRGGGVLLYVRCEFNPIEVRLSSQFVEQVWCSVQINKKLSYCWETVRRESMLRIAEMDVEMTT